VNVHVTGTEWPVRCAGQPGGIRAWESLETDPQAPLWRLVTDWCFRPRRERERHGVRRVGAAEVLLACPELAGRLF
jgi:hypothetical protein